MKAFLFLLAVSTMTANNKTSDFLGPEDQWPKCHIVLEDIQGLFGGTAIHLDGSGPCIIRIVDRGKEKRFKLKLTPKETKALRKACIDADLLTVKIKDRMGVPDEARPTIILTNAKGNTFKLAKWANDKVPRFDKVYEALLDLREKTKGIKPEYDGKWEREWKPVKKVGTSKEVEAIRSVLPDGWSISKVENNTYPCYRPKGNGEAIHLRRQQAKRRKQSYDAIIHIMPADYKDGGDDPTDGKAQTYPAKLIATTSESKIYLWGKPREWPTLEQDVIRALAK